MRKGEIGKLSVHMLIPPKKPDKEYPNIQYLENIQYLFFLLADGNIIYKDSWNGMATA